MRNIIVTIFSLALVILVLEFFLRFLFSGMLEHKIVKISSDPAMGYELKPEIKSSYSGFFHKIPPTTIEINQQGFRDRLFILEKTPGMTRIAFLGDSYVFGLGLNLEQSIPKQLETFLNRNSTIINYEVMNCGVIGYNLS